MFNKIIFFIILIFIAGCANPQPPSGGPPDKTPPEINEFRPANKTLNFSDDEVVIYFNKYMDKNSVIENTFVSPSKKLNFGWNGKKLTIGFDEKLDSNTTYAILLGTDYRDLKQNKPTQAFTLIFSTGKYIDTSSIKGILYDDNPSGTYIFAYYLTGSKPDTLNPKHTKPKYKTQVGSNGTFEFKALKPGTYRLIAIRDQYKDDIYDEGIDAFSAASEDITVSDSTVPFITMKIGPPVDKVGPLLYEVEALSCRRLSASFSESLDTASVTAGAFTVQDTSGKITIPVLSAFLSSKSSSKVELIAASTLDTAFKWMLIVTNDSAITVRDSSGNAIQDTGRKSIFLGSSEKDSTKLQLMKIPFADSSKNINPKKEISLLFNIPFIDEYFRNRIGLINTTGKAPVEFRINWKMENYLSIVPDPQLQSETFYEFTFIMDSLNVFSKYFAKDSTIKLRFKTDDIRSNTTVSGTIKDSLNWGGNYIVILVSKEYKRKFYSKADEKLQWKFEDVPPGNYGVEVFCDANKNGKLDYGNAYPYQYSEKFFVSKKELQVKARWKVENMIIELK